MTSKTNFLNDRDKLVSHLLIAFYALQRKDEYDAASETILNRLRNVRQRLLDEQKKVNFRKSFLLALGLTFILIPLYVANNHYYHYYFLPGFIQSFFRLDALRGLLFIPVTVSTGATYSVMLLSWFGIYRYLNTSLITDWKELEEKFGDDSEFTEELKIYRQARRDKNNFIQSKKFESDTAFLPDQYRDSGTVSYLFKLVDTRRADTFKESLNIYEDDLHKFQMRNMQQQALNEQQYTLEATRNIERHARNTAVLSAMSYYQNSKRNYK